MDLTIRLANGTPRMSIWGVVLTGGQPRAVFPADGGTVVRSPQDFSDLSLAIRRGLVTADIDGTIITSVAASDAAAAGGVFHLSSGGFTSILWSPSGNGDVQTWAQVKSRVDRTKSPVMINVIDTDVTHVIDDDADLHNSWIVSPAGFPGAPLVRVVDGVQLTNLAKLSGGFQFETVSTARAPLLFTPEPGDISAFLADYGTTIINSGSVPMFSVPDGEFFAFGFTASASVSPGTAPVVNLGNGSVLILRAFNTGLTIDPGFVSGPASAVIGIQQDGTYPLPFPPGYPLFAGTTFNCPIGVVGGTGPTALRPFPLFGPLAEGVIYTDLDIVPPRPIFLRSGVWYNMDGTPVLPCTTFPNPSILTHTGYRRCVRRRFVFR